MRIFFISSFPAKNDGVSDYTKDMITSLRTLGVQVDSAKIEKPFSVTYRKAWTQVIAQIKDKHPDVVHIQYTPTSLGYGLLSGLKRLRSLHVPVVLTVHEKPDFFIDRLPRILIKPYLLWERKVFRLASRLIVHTKDQYVDIRIRYDVPAEQLQVIPHYIQDTPAKHTNGTLRLVSLGRIVPKKRLDMVIEALAELRKEMPDLKLLVIGQAPNRYADYAHNLKRLAEQFGVSSAVEWKGYVSESDLHELLSTHDLAILPYLMATQSGAAFKLLSHHVPLLTNNLPAFEELMKQYTVGLSRPLHYSTDVVNAVQEVSSHPEWPKWWAQEITRLKKEQSLVTIAQLHLKLYTDLCQNTSV